MKVLLLNRDEDLIDYIEIFNPEDEESINSDSILKFETYYIGIEKGYRILYKDKYNEWHEYIIQSYKKRHNANNDINLEVYAENSFYETLGDFIEDKRPRNVTATAALSQALSSSRWEVGIVENLGLNSTNFYRCSVKDAVQNKIVKVWGGEFSTTIKVVSNKIISRKVNIYRKRGDDIGKRFVYNKDAFEIEKIVDEENVITALYGFGKGEEIEETGGYGRRIDFSDINSGKKYVENLEAKRKYGRNSDNGKVHVFGKIEFDDVTDKRELLEKTKEELEKASIPHVTYHAQVEDLAKYGFEYEGVRLGDTVTVIDKEMGTRLRARVIKLVRDLDNSRSDKITLGNVIPTTSDLFIEAYKKINNFRDKEAIWDKTSKKLENGIDAEFLNNIVEKLNTEINNDGGYVYISNDGKGVTTYDKPIDQNPTKAIQLMGGAIRIANSKKSDGTWNWRSFGTGDGFVADEIITGILKGGNVRWNLNDGTFLIGKNEDDYLLKFDGSTLKFGDSSIKSENLDEPLKEELKGESSFTHIVYADNGDEEGTFFIEPEDHKWIGIAVTDDPIRPILKSDYKWSKYTGEDGKRGPKGEDGRPGRDGVDGSLAELPESLKNWDSKSTEINGKYVYTPELFVGTDRDSTYNRTGIYMGDGIRTGEGFISGICGLSNGNVVWKMTPTGAGYIGFDSNRRISWSPRGEVNIPKIRSSDIETKAITTDLLYPGNNNRIVLERGYSPGSNNCKSIDANGSAIRLKVDADTYISMRDSGIVEMYSRNGQFFKFDPRESWYYNGHEGDGWLVLHDAHVSMGWLEYSVYSTRSDRRLKENIKYIKNKQKGLNRENIFDFIKTVDLATYRYKKTGGNNISMIAQDVEEFKFIKDYLVGKNKDGIRLINTGNYTSMMHIALQEEIKKREVLEDKVKSQESRIKRLEKLLLNGGEKNA